MSIFSKVSFRKPKKTVHNLSYSTKFSLPFGRLVPIMCEKVVPGDKVWHSHEFFLRMAPFVNQVFQGFQVRTEYYFVPSRLLWKNFEMWLSKGMDGSSEYVHPFISYKDTLTAFVNENHDNINTIFDYLNLPTLNAASGGGFDIDPSTISDDLKIDALPFYAMCKVFLDYYADENLDYAPLIQAMESNQVFVASSFNINLTAVDGKNNLNLRRYFARLQGVGATSGSYVDTFAPLKRSWPKDYFTSALPFAQRGPVVQIPLNGSGDVDVFVKEGSTRYHNVSMTTQSTGDDVGVTLYQGAPIDSNGAVQNETSLIDSQNTLSFKAVNINGTATITDLRTAIAIQNFLEKRARGGSRAKEQIFSSFGVKTRDYRLDRSELLQANTNFINIGEVYTATANESETDVPGMAVSTGKSANSSKVFKHFFEEHGYLIGFMSVFPTASYYQGIPRQFMELDQFDYYWPEFQHIGEQDVSTRELYLDGTPDVFGYQPRYSQYKTRTNQIHSEFRTNLKFMTAAREFLSVPSLSNNFIQINPEVENLYKVFRVNTPLDNSNPVYVDLYHHNKFLRPMSYFGSPRFL